MRPVLLTLAACAALTLAAALTAPQALAQQAAARPQQSALVAATEDRLWTARVDPPHTVLSYRERTGQSTAADPLNARLVALAAAGEQAYAFQEDGSFCRYADEWLPALNLPGRRIPLNLTAVDGIPYALLESQIAAELPAFNAAARAEPARPLAPTSAPLTLIHYDQLGWSAVAPCPTEVTTDGPPELRPRLCGMPARLMLFSQAAQGNRLNCWTFVAATGQWLPGPPSPEMPGLTGFWIALVNRLPTLVLDGPHPNGRGSTLQFFRLVGDSANSTWQPASLDFSPLPATAGGPVAPPPRAASPAGAPAPPPAEMPVSPDQAATSPGGTAARLDQASVLVDVCGFNQHLALEVELPDGSAYLRFGRFEGPPTLDTIDLLAVPPQNLLPMAWHVMRAAVMLGILVSLFVFRRGSLAAPFPLARGQAPAFVVQRFGALLVDLAPFTILAAVVLRLNWAHAVGEVAGLLSDPQPQRDLPDAALLSWMLLAAGAYAVYCLVMELIANRTFGKMLVGLQVVAEQGGRAPARRVVIRNLFRTIEILPPFWILAFIVLLSRNRQRVGDIFARTMVVRHVATQSDSDRQFDE